MENCRKILTLRSLLLAGILLPALCAQNDWPVFGHDSGATRFSPLAQINTRNVATLRPVWTYEAGEVAGSFEVTPLVIGNVMYISTPRERVLALDADTGREIWAFEGSRVPRPSPHRGVSYWPGDRQTPPRIFAATTDGRLYALDAKSGKPAASFGDNGMLNLRAGVADKFPNAPYGFSSPPAIYKNIIILGPRTQESPAKGPAGDIRAFDAINGKQVWTFHTLPRPGEPGFETWGPEFWKDGSGPSAWAALTVDQERGLVFIPIGNPAGGGDPADRKGNDRYANCVVALDAATGHLRWYFQTVHHDVWDYDAPAPPTLIDVVQNGRKIPALAQITKHGMLFLLDRITGKPIFGAEERPVPQSKIAGEELSPTQPFPLKPPPLARNRMTASEISRITPESERFCADLVANRELGGPFPARGAGPSINFPSSIGGGNWGGVSFDASLGLIFVNTSNLGSVSGGRGGRGPAGGAPPAGKKAAGDSEAGRYFGETGGPRFVDQDRYPCNQPPWGELIAVNANTGDIAWRVTLGSYKELEDKGIKDTGAANLGGSIATAGGLLFIGATNDLRFRAFDSRTGKQLWMVDLDGNALATPVTYQSRNGKQYLAVISGGPAYLNSVGPQRSGVPSKITAFALP